MVERKTRVRGAQVLEESIKKGDLTATGETEGHVATVQADGSVDYEAPVAGTPTSIQDTDGDTKVQTEESGDEDIIRFDAFGTQEAQIDINGLTLKTGASVNEFSTDGTLAGDSDDAIPTEKAVKTYADTKAGTFTQSFTNATLSSGILTVTHSLGVQYVNFTIYDNSGLKIMPDDATATSTTVLTIDLTSSGTLTGTWNIRVTG